MDYYQPHNLSGLLSERVGRLHKKKSREVLTDEILSWEGLVDFGWIFQICRWFIRVLGSVEESRTQPRSYFTAL